jgi:preprotein translocase subunit Sec63
LSGEDQHEAGDFDWYEDWMEWARRVYESEQRGFEQQQQQQQQQQYQRQSQQQQYQRQSQKTKQTKKAKPDYQWDFDPNDPYSVLKVSRGATQKEISQAFRREMLKYHPDTQTNASEAERDRATERSKIISEAYQKLKVKK